MRDTFVNLAIGLSVSVVVVFLLLAANFELLSLSLVVLSSVPAVVCGVIVALVVTGTSVNVQSFMGAILAIGVALANSILLVTFAERIRREGVTSTDAAIRAAQTRLRPILMTSLAMIVGMIPMALANEATAPLARAVIGGLLFATLATLIILPSVFGMVQARARIDSGSLDPDDPASKFSDSAGKVS
jgi:multidrug efflux pump subunit AcrB